LLTAGVDVQLTEKYLVISDPLRRLEIAGGMVSSCIPDE
jgi:hypothetical protein